LLNKLKKDLLRSNNKKYLEHLINLINQRSFDVVFNHEDALHHAGEFLNIHHPIIQSIISSKGKKLYKRVLFCLESLDNALEKGLYIVLEYECTVNLDSIRYANCFFQVGFKVIDDNINRIDSLTTLKSLFNFSNWKSCNQINIESDVLHDVEVQAKAIASAHFKTQYNKIENKISNELQLKRDSLQNMRTKEMAMFKGKIESTSDPNKLNLYKDSLNEIENEIKINMEDIPTIDNIQFVQDLIFCSIIEKN